MTSTPEGIEAAAPEEGRRPLPILLGVIAVVVVLFLVWTFVLSGDDEPVDGSAPAPAPVEAPAEEDDARSAKKSPVETFEVFAPKDPFDPLVSASTAGGGSTAAPVEGDVGATTLTTSGTAGTTTTTTITGGGEDNDRVVDGHRVRVIDVFAQRGRRAQVQIDGTVYTVDEGEQFAENFQLLSTSGSCATMLFGDEEFTLCEGEEILK